MRKKYKSLIIFILILAMIFAVSGCGNDKDSKDKKEEKTEETDSFSEDSLIMKVNKEKIYYDEAMFYLLMLKQEYEPSLGKDIWDFDQGNGETFEGQAKDEIISEISQLKIIRAEAEKLKITLGEDEKSEVKEVAAAHLKEIAPEDAEKYAITLEVLEEIYSEHFLAKKVFDVVTSEVDTEVLDEDAKQVSIQQIYISTKITDKDGNEKSLTEKEKAKTLKKVKALLKEAKKTEDFKTFAEANTQDGQVEYTIGKEDADKLITQTAFALKTGELSGIVETENGYYIIYCVSDFDEDATAAKKEEIILDRQKEMFQKTYQDWSKDYDITVNSKVWDKVTFK